MNAARIVLVVIGLIQGGWFMADGTRALLHGNYFTAQTGPQAGQLGPWSRLVRAIGLDPRSTAMKCVHVALGVLWLAAAATMVVKATLGWTLLLCAAVGSLWYLPLGTILSLVALGLLCLPATRS